MSIQQFSSSALAHAHSLETLNLLQCYDTFMESVDSIVDMGCGCDGLELEWWATRMTRDDEPRPLNIKCTGVDLVDTCKAAHTYDNAAYRRHNFEDLFATPSRYDVIWAHNVFHLALNPLVTLRHWYDIATPGAMLAVVLPHFTNFEFNQVDFTTVNHSYYNHTVTSLMYMLAVNGWDCSEGFFKKVPGDPWLSAVVYKSAREPSDPRTTTWYDLAEAGMLPATAAKSINSYGFLRQRDLVLPWLDKNLIWMGHE